MAEYIPRQKALEEMRKWCEPCGSGIEAILAVPAADVAPVVHGRWEGYTHSRYIGCDEYGNPKYADGTVYYCSNRRCRRKSVIKERYCPSCGTKMDGGEDNEKLH